MEAVRSSPRLPFFTFDRIHRTKPGGNHGPRSISPRREIDQFSIETKKKEIEKYIRRSFEQIVFSIRRTEASLSRFTVVSSPTSVAIDVAPMISILVPIDAHAPTSRYKGYADKGNKHPRDRSGGGSLINRIQLAARENKRPFPLLELRSISSFSLDYYSLVSTVFSGWRGDNLGRHHLSFIRARFSLYREERS